MTRFTIAALFLCLTAAGLSADEDDQDRPPERGVARISLINGDVSVRRGDSGDVVAAAVNAPLVIEDRLLTASSSRAEIQFDSANMLRVGAHSEVRLGELQFQQYRMQVAIGTVTFRVLRDSNAQAEVDTPLVGIRPLRRGVYRITVREDGGAEITVREGELEVITHRGSERVPARNTMLVRGTEDDPEFQIVAEIGPDEFDHWNANRDRDLQRSRSYQYVSPDINGAEDLDQYGRWVNDPSYGQVWAPTVESDWAPYRAGRWVWEDYYGWTWVSHDPWGWAPYHYGRWFYGSYGWCWYPGAIHARHYWSPALVAFFGFGGYGGFRSGIGFGFGNVGWVPLAPHERFQPWWGRGGYYGSHTTIVNNTTIINNSNIEGMYRNARIANGVTGVNAADFGRNSGRFTSVHGQSIREAGLVRGVLPVTPDRSSLRYADRQVRTSEFSQSRANRFYGAARQQPSQRIPFDQQQRNMDWAARRTFSGGPSLNGGMQQPAADSHAWQRFGEPVHSTTGAAPSSGGWARYSDSRSYPSASPRSTGPTQRGAWERFGPSAPGTPTTARPQYSDRGWNRGNYPAPAPVYTPPTPTYMAPRSDGGGRGWGGGGQAVHISPPIVHERPSPPPHTAAPTSHGNSGGGGNRGGGAGGGRGRDR